VFALAGLLLSVFFVRETHSTPGMITLLNALRHSHEQAVVRPDLLLRAGRIARCSPPARLEWSIISRWAGLGLFPLFSPSGPNVAQIGCWPRSTRCVGIAQLGTGALSDRLGRKGLIVADVGAGGRIGLVVLTQGCALG